MPTGTRVTLYLTDDEKKMLDAIAERQNLSRSEVMRHLLVYQGMCGGDFPLTRRIFGLDNRDRQRIIGRIADAAASNQPAKPQAFRQWVKETIGSDNPEDTERAMDALMNKLLAA